MNEIDTSEIETKFYDLCRLCASYDNVKISVFSDEGKRRQLCEKIQSFLPFKIEENDGLPKSLCYKCVYNLETTYEFRHKCIQVNRCLEEQLHKKESDNTLKNVGRCQSNKIHPEVSIFAIPSQYRRNEIDEEATFTFLESESESPNPMDFLEVGARSDESMVVHTKCNIHGNKKSRKVDKRWLSVEHKPLHNDSPSDSKTNVTHLDWTLGQDENGSRRKSCNPRRIARENEETNEVSLYPPTEDVITISSCSSTNTMNVSEAATMNCHCSSECEEQEDEADLSKQQVFTCLLCEKNFSLRLLLDEHFSSMHGIEPYEVTSQAANATESLSQSFMKQLMAEREVGDHSGTDASGGGGKGEEEELESMMEQETVIVCEVCRREFQDRASLWLHMVHAHREEASVSCGICLKICCDNITLIEHVNTAHSSDKAVVQRRYSCQVCGRQHDSRQKLLKHATLHTLIDNQGQTIQPEEMVSLNNAFAPRECSMCHRKFFNEEKLNHHMQSFHNYTNENSVSLSSTCALHKCELCSSAHATRMDRWWHMYYSHSGDTRVTCERNSCRKVFVSVALKDQHSKTHHEMQGNFTNTCEICGKLWESRTVFYKHMMNVHPKCLPTICGVCTKVFSSVPELRTHVRNEHTHLQHSTTSVCCDICGRPYAERSKMLRHRRVHNVRDSVPFTASTTTATAMKKKDDLVCAFCPHLNFDEYQHVAEHRRNVHQLFVCDLCPKFYNGNNHLWKHVSKQHKGDPNVTCNICLRTSASRAHLERHKLKYHSDPFDKLIHKQTKAASATATIVSSISHKCGLCGKIFRIRSLLKKHLKSCKGAKPTLAKVQPVNGVFPCAKCGKVFELQNLLYKHMKNSHVQHTCEVCPSPAPSFDTKKDLLGHIRERHSNHHELVCDVAGCGKVLRLKADLKKHKLEHARGYFTYICEICGDMFSNRKKLRKHLQTYHKSDVKFLCAVCVAIHPSLQDLTTHVHSAHPFVLHRPYTCQICGKCWSVSSKAVEHISKVHGKEYRPCKICWKVFTDQRIFEQHTNHHPPIEQKSSATTPMLTDSHESSSVLSPTDVDNCKSSAASDASKNALLPSPKLSSLTTAVSLETDDSLKRSLEEDSFREDGDACKRLRRKYKCVSCKQTFRSTDELNAHTEAEHAQRPREHVNDESTSENPIAIVAAPAEVKHASNKFERWTSIRPIACDCCDKIWNSKKQLWQHLIRSHAYESQYACGICLQVCRDYFDLFYHLDSQHSTIINDHATNKFSCFICGHYHNSQSKLDKHFSLHKNAPARYEYTCQYCRKLFKSITYYRDHACLHAIAAPTEPKVKTYSEFSGFSINHILATKNDRRCDSETVVADTIDQSNSATYFDDGTYDVKYEGEKMQQEVNDDDLVEELTEGDDNESNGYNQSSDEHDSNTFKGYDACSPPPKYMTTSESDRSTDVHAYALHLASEYSVLSNSAAKVLNGDSATVPVDCQSPSFIANSDQKQKAEFESDTKTFS